MSQSVFTCHVHQSHQTTRNADTLEHLRVSSLTFLYVMIKTQSGGYVEYYKTTLDSSYKGTLLSHKKHGDLLYWPKRSLFSLTIIKRYNFIKIHPYRWHYVCQVPQDDSTPVSVAVRWNQPSACSVRWSINVHTTHNSMHFYHFKTEFSP